MRRNGALFYRNVVPFFAMQYALAVINIGSAKIGVLRPDNLDPSASDGN